jgi:CDP-ribitol ribitolphosphotransferase / teichoic acid ribitol-phosphate polymerase
MKAILFCANPYAFGILKPLHDELKAQGHETLWYVPEKILPGFSFQQHVQHTASMQEVYNFQSDAIFVPGNEVPHYLRGVKVQVFHGLAGEKTGHFRIRNYFDLYLTQGPYFTKRFEALAKKEKDFDVTETGWCKLDALFQHHETFLEERNRILRERGKQKLVLYAPTFSPSLTSTKTAFNEIFSLADQEDIFLLIKFHDLMDRLVVDQYKAAAKIRDNVHIIEDRNIVKYLIMSDVMISDTSSVVYEFILLNKPVITIKSTSENITWCDVKRASDLSQAFKHELTHDTFQEKRLHTIAQYHPYTDGKSSARMIDAVQHYIQQHGVPETRKVNIWRRYTMKKMFGPKPL